MPEERLPSQLAMSFPSVKSLKELPFATSNPESVIREASQGAVELMPPSSVTLRTAARPESDSLQDPEKPSTEIAEQLLASLLEEAEMTSQL